MKNKASIIKAAQKYTAKGQIDKAISEWEKLLDAGKDGNVYNTIGDLYYKRGSEPKAIEAFTKAAEIFKAEGFFPKAMAIYKKILHIVPNDVNALASIARLDADRGLTGSAIENYFKVAEIYKRADELEKTIQVVDQIIKMSPSDINTRTKIADLYIRSGLKGKASEEYISIAAEYLMNEELDHAQTFYTKATQLEPRNPGSWVGLSVLAERADNIDQAFEYLRTALSHQPKDKEALLGFARLALQSGKTDQAKKTLVKLKETYPLEPRARELLGEVYLSEGSVEEAWDELSQHVDKIIEKQNWDEAIDYLLRFAEKFPIPVNQRLMHIYKNNSDTENLNRIRKWLAAMYREGDLLDESLQLYRDYLDDHPGDQSVIKEIHELENAIGIPHFTETPLGGGDDDFEGDLITPELLTENGTVPEENDTQLPELTLLHDEIDLGGGTEDEPVMSKTAQDISPEEFAGKKEEADFYAQQGIYDEAIKIYELLVLSFPDNEEIRHELASLKSRTGETLDIVVEKISGQENEAGEDRLALQDEYNQIDLMGDVDQEEATEDFERYYNAGVDFREKGLMEDAIRALQIASRDPDNMQRNAKLLATCYLEIGSYPLAIAEFHKIIEKMSSEDEGFIDLQYDLAGAYAENRDYHKAFEMYEEINERSPQFRDVTDKIDALREQMVTDADRPKTKKDRVSYI